MSDLHDIRIASGLDPHTSSVMLDGIEVKGITRLTLDMDPREFTRLVLEFVPGTVRVTAKGTLEVNGREL